MGKLNGNLASRLVTSVKTRGIKTTTKRVISKLSRMLVTKSANNHVFYKDEVVHLAFYPSGGLGDYIISKSVLEEIIAIANCKVTIFCDKREFAEAVYGDVSTEIVEYENYDSDFYKYDLALYVEHFVHVDCFKEKKINCLSPELSEKIRLIIDNWDELYVDIKQQCWRERIQFERCRIKGLDRWTELRMGGAFAIAYKKVSIPCSDTAKARWKREFGKVRYITINYGADAMILGRTQLKLWGKNGYQELIDLVHKYDNNIKVIQLGSRDAERINNADMHVFGEALDYIKCILNGSVCHIDCEGGLVHLATQLGTRCIVLFGPTPSYMYAYDQNINMISSRCSGCMGLHDNWAYDCFLQYDSPICMSNISAEMVFCELVKVLNNENDKQVN